MTDLLTIKELAAVLGKSRTYVHAMIAAGFEMPGRTATLQEARDWLRANPDFSCTAYAAGKKAKPVEIKSIEIRL